MATTTNMTLPDFTTGLKSVLRLTEKVTIPEMTEEVYKLASLPKELKEIVSDTSTYFTVPNTVPDLRPYVFAGCTVLQNVTLPENTTSIPEAAFLDCVGLSKVQVAGSGSTGTSTYSLDIPPSVTSISKQAFKNTSSLTGVLSIPRHITEIDDEAFSGSGFSEIQIPSSVGRIGVEAFANCPNLSKVTFVDDFCSYNTPSGPASWDTAYDKLYLDSRVFANTPKLTCIIMPDKTYNRLSPRAFEDSSITFMYFRTMRLRYDRGYFDSPAYDPLQHPCEFGVCGREPWGGGGTHLYDIWFVKDPCKEEILPCYYTYKLEESNKRWVCEKEDGEPCTSCTGNVQIADYTLSQKVFEYNNKPDSRWTIFEESYDCYYPPNDTYSGYRISYDTYERIPDDLRLDSRFERTEYAHNDQGWEMIGWIESDNADALCDPDAAPEFSEVYIRPRQEDGVNIPCIVSFQHSTYYGTKVTDPQYFKLTDERKLTSLCLGGQEDLEWGDRLYVLYTDVVSPDSACAIKTSVPDPASISVEVGDETDDVTFTGVPVDLGPFTVITKVDQTT